MEKVIRNGKVAVLYSPGYGAGWSTWNSNYKDLLLFHPALVDLVEKEDYETLTDEDKVKALLALPNDEYVCVLGGRDLRIEWLDEGTDFYIREYDGSESICTGHNDFTRA